MILAYFYKADQWCISTTAAWLMIILALQDQNIQVVPVQSSSKNSYKKSGLAVWQFVEVA